MRRRTARLALAATVLASSVAWAASASAQRDATPRRAPRMATTSVRAAVSSGSRHTLVVSVQAGGRQSRLVHIYVTGQSERSVRAYPHQHAKLTYRLNAGRKQIVVRAINAPPAVVVTATIEKVAAATGSTGSTAPAGGTSASGTSGTSGATGATGTTTVRTSPGSQITNPYTNLLWSDDFVSDYNSGASAPLANNWSLDVDSSPGGCGAGTQSTFTDASANASLTSQGLAITANSNGSGGYSSAQLDGNGLLSIPVGATIEASIALPQGQGLCPAFWMLGDSSAAGTSWPAEIDILEAPSFTGSQWGPVAPYAVFTLHAPDSGTNQQVYEEDASPAGWDPTQFNTYGIVWTGTSITWFVNGLAYATASASSLPAGTTWSSFDTNFHLFLDLAVGGWPGSSTVPSATMEVQWVRVYN